MKAESFNQCIWAFPVWARLMWERHGITMNLSGKNIKKIRGLILFAGVVVLALMKFGSVCGKDHKAIPCRGNDCLCDQSSDAVL